MEKPMMLELDGMTRFVRVREETRKVDAAGLIRVDGNAYQLAREFAQQEVQLLIDEFKIVVTRKARLIDELDKVELGRGRGISNLDKKARITRPAPLI